MAAKYYPTDTGSFILTDLTLLPTCTLTKMKSDDGFWEYVEEKAYLGKRYKYSPRSRARRILRNEKSGREFSCDTVLVYDPRGHFALMPVECLDLDHGYREN